MLILVTMEVDNLYTNINLGGYFTIFSQCHTRGYFHAISRPWYELARQPTIYITASSHSHRPIPAIIFFPYSSMANHSTLESKALLFSLNLIWSRPLHTGLPPTGNLTIGLLRCLHGLSRAVKSDLGINHGGNCSGHANLRFVSSMAVCIFLHACIALPPICRQQQVRCLFVTSRINQTTPEITSDLWLVERYMKLQSSHCIRLRYVHYRNECVIIGFVCLCQKKKE